jgi:hypothetical protein
VKAADLSACLDLQPKTLPEFGIMREYRVNDFDCDCPPAW